MYETRKSLQRSGMESMEAAGPVCGHGGCGPDGCNVRYAGPTTHIRDHHVLHAAKGASQVWTAAIVAGLAVVLTGAIAFNSVDAQQIPTTSPVGSKGQDAQYGQILKRLNDIEKKIDGIAKRVGVGGGNALQGGVAGNMIDGQGGLGSTGAPSKDPKACISACGTQLSACPTKKMEIASLRNAELTASAKATLEAEHKKLCTVEYNSCVKACYPATNMQGGQGYGASE